MAGETVELGVIRIWNQSDWLGSRPGPAICQLSHHGHVNLPGPQFFPLKMRVLSTSLGGCEDAMRKCMQNSPLLGA